MSATGRNLAGNERHGDDFYETPAWCVERIIGNSDLICKDERLSHVGSDLSGPWLEPSAGNGAIIKAVNKTYSDYSRDMSDDSIVPVNWVAVEKRPEPIPLLNTLCNGDVICEDFLSWNWDVEEKGKFDVAILNPPYSLAEEFIRRCLLISRITVALLRLNFLGSNKRALWLREFTPSVYVLPNRPSFTGKGTDATEYAWFVWGLDPIPTIKILPPLSKAERADPLSRWTQSPEILHL